MKSPAKPVETSTVRSTKVRLRRRLKEMLAGKKPEPLFPLINPSFQPYRRIIE